MGTKRRMLFLTVILSFAGCYEPTAMYKPGLSVSEARDAYDRIAYSVLTTGPIIRTGREEGRVFAGALEDFGFRDVPLDRLPEGVVVWTSPGGYTRIAGRPDPPKVPVRERWVVPPDAAARVPAIDALLTETIAQRLIDRVSADQHQLWVSGDWWAGLTRDSRRDFVRVYSCYFYAKTGSDRVVVAHATTDAVVARYDGQTGLELTEPWPLQH